MLLIIVMCRKITSHWQPLFPKKMAAAAHHFLTKLVAVASFSYKIGGGGLIFLQNWWRPKFESMGAQGASQQTSSRHARLRYSMKLSRQSISFHLKLCANASAGTKECAESPTPVIEENHTSQVLVDIHTKTKKSNIFFK